MIAAPDRPVADLDASAIEAPIVYVNVESGADRSQAGGKGKGSRWNAVRHGCMAEVLLPADLAAEVEQFTTMLTEHYRPTSGFEAGQIAKMGRIGAQLERNQKMQVVDRQRSMDRAVLCWDSDRYAYVDELVKKLPHDAGVARALAGSRQGADWLLRSWNGLGDVLKTHGKWNDEQVRLALDMLAYPVELRDGNTWIKPNSTTAELAAIVAMKRDELDEKLESCLIPLDHAERMMAAAGMPGEEDAQTKRLRKQEARLKLDFRRARAELLESRAPAEAQAAGTAPAEAQAPVATSTRAEPARKPNPTSRPHTSNAAHNFQKKRSSLKAFHLPETAGSPARRVAIQYPFSGGDPEPESAFDSEPENAAGFDARDDVEPARLAEPAIVQPQPASVATSDSRSVVNQRQRDRKSRRDQEKKARKAARRRRR